jgi:16S rRNA (uracil1498-N3)-methyltransferase
MRNRYLATGDLVPGATIPLLGEELHHAARVARVRVGEEIELFDGKGAIVVARVEEVDRDRLVTTVIAPLAETRELPLRIVVGMSIIQLERFELVLQKATELGAASFVPLFTDRCEIRPERVAGKMERWERIVFEATKQSGRGVIPRVDSPCRLDELLSRSGRKILYESDQDETASLEEVVAMDEVILLIGPEGGWSEQELESTRRSECLVRHLGNRRLRAETAAIAAVAEISLSVDRIRR